MIRKYANFQILSATLVAGRGLGGRTASFAKGAHRYQFEYEKRPGFIYVRSRAISSRCNDNYDEFPAGEIKQAYATFVGKPVFVNHHNSNHRQARGVIIAAVLHEDTNPDGTPDTWVEVLMEIDAVKFPKLAQAILAGEIDRTSMGCDVEYSLCSFCGNKAATPLDYCAHIPKLKGQRIRRRTANGTQEDVLVREICYGIRFFENSVLVEDPADPTAFFLGEVEAGPGVMEALGVTASKTAMATTETYRGVKIKVKKGKEWGYTALQVNGHGWFQQMGSEEKVLAMARATVDAAIEDPRPDAYEDYWKPGHKGTPDPSAWQGHRCASLRIVHADDKKPWEKEETKAPDTGGDGDGEFDESEHPRDEDGKFVPKTTRPRQKPSLSPEQQAALDQAQEPLAGNEVTPEVPGEAGGEVIPKPGSANIPEGQPGSKTAPIKTDNVEEAISALVEGKYVELTQPRQLSTMLDRLAAMVEEAKAGGGSVNVNLCQVSVEGTNLFCTQSKGIPRIKMPQLKVTKVLPGSRAETELTPDEDGEYDLQPMFRERLQEMGYEVVEEDYLAANLKATQNELRGDKIAGMTQHVETGGSLGEEAIFVSSDDYIVDGHHRWASTVAADFAGDEVADDLTLPILRVNMSIIELLAEANTFAEEWGAPPLGVTGGLRVVTKDCGCGGVKIAKRGQTMQAKPSLRRRAQRRFEKTAARKLVPVEKIKVGDSVRISPGSDWVVTDVKAVTYDVAGNPGTRLFFAEHGQGMSFKNGEVLSVDKPGRRGLTDEQMDERMRSAPGYGQGKTISNCPLCNKVVTYPDTDTDRFHRHTYGFSGQVCEASGKTLAEVYEIVERDRQKMRWSSRHVATDGPEGIPQEMWDRMDRMGEALDAIVAKKRSGPIWERPSYDDRPRAGWRCMLVGNEARVYWCRVEPTLYGAYVIDIKPDQGYSTIESAEEEDPARAIAVAERMMKKVAGWTFWDEKRRRDLEMGPYRASRQAGWKPSGPGPGGGTFTAEQLGRMTMEQVENWYHQGLVTQDEWEGYMYVWQTSAPRMTDAYAGYAEPSSEEVRRIGDEILATTRRSGKKLGYGEIKAPAQVDTLREEDCPVCGESTSYDGDKCLVCGFVRPPSSFMDPDLNKARETDLRQQADDLPADQEANLRCNSCGATFQGSDDVVDDQVGEQKPATDDPANGDDPTAQPQEATDGAKKKPPLDQRKRKAPPKTSAMPSKPGQPAGQFQPLAPPKSGEPTKQEEREQEDGNADTAPKAGDTCPNCGQGTLESIPKSIGDDDGHLVHPEMGDRSGEGGPPNAEGKDEPVDQEKPGEEPSKADPDKEPADADDAEKDEDGKPKKKKPPFPPKGSSILSNGVSVLPKGWNDLTKESDMRPALQLILAQQQVITQQGAALARIASLAGLEKDPTVLNALRATAALQRMADENNPTQPIPDPPAEAPAQTTEEALGNLNDEDVTTQGATSVTDVSADATTSLADTGPVLDTPLDLNEQDVTRPVAGTEEVRPLSETKTETEVRIGDPNKPDTMWPVDPNWTTKGSSKQPSQARTIASIRLARLRIQADIAAGDDLDIATDIDTSEMSDEAIQGEINTLSKVVHARAGGEQRQPTSRRLVPRNAAQTRATPSLAGLPFVGDGAPSGAAPESNLVAAGNIAALASVSDDEVGLFD